MVNLNLIEKLGGQQKKIPDFRAGDIVRVTMKFMEAGTEHSQSFTGTVIRKRGKGLDATFSVHRMSFGISVEKTFPLYSPKIEKIELIKRGNVRHSRPYYLRKISKIINIEGSSSQTQTTEPQSKPSESQTQTNEPQPEPKTTK